MTHITAKLSLYASAAALAMIAAAWTHGAAAQQPFALYTPMPRTQAQTPAYDPQHKSTAPADSKKFGLYTSMPPAAAGTGASPSLAEAPSPRADTSDPNHQPANP